MPRSKLIELETFFTKLLPSPLRILEAYRDAFRNFGWRAYSLSIGYLFLRFRNQLEPEAPFHQHTVSAAKASIEASQERTVTIIIPTRDGLELLRSCVDSILEKTTGVNFNISIVNNGSTQERTLSYLKNISRNPRIQIIDDNGDFNFSRLNNHASQSSTSEFLCLLNNDTKILDSKWLCKMIEWATVSEVGAVGSSLLYEDGTVQHAGVALGRGGVANHFFQGSQTTDENAKAWCSEPRRVSAVTAACLLVSAEKYRLVGGLDERLAVGFNDVDFCLRLSQAGFINVLVPGHSVMHLESKTRGTNHKARFSAALNEVLLMMQRWGRELKKGDL